MWVYLNKSLWRFFLIMFSSGGICLPEQACSKCSYPFSHLSWCQKAWLALSRETNRSFRSFQILFQNVKVRKIIKYKSSHRHSEVSGRRRGSSRVWLWAKCVSSILGPHLPLPLSGWSWSPSLGVRDAKWQPGWLPCQWGETRLSG